VILWTCERRVAYRRDQQFGEAKMSLWSEAEKFTSRPIIFQFTSSTWQVLNRTTTFIEIGICKVGSLQLWKRYLGPFAQIVGIDIDPTCKVVEEDQIAVRIGDQSDLNFLQKIINEFGSLMLFWMTAVTSGFFRISLSSHK
jgi:23S rRNA U2552 (ribose-2'-O)-methylase RlmE/FtsJ